MITVPIEHKSRTADIVMNFPATENNLGWSFIAKNNGELYYVMLSNVASYSIGGVPVTVSPATPYAVVGQAEYPVTITKTTNGLPASITFISRRAVNETVIINVPDYSSYTGREWFGITSGGSVYLIDCQLLLPANYIGAGAYTLHPLLVTLSLPTLPNSAIWKDIRFVDFGGSPKMMCIALSTSPAYAYACYIDCTNYLIYSMTGVLNSYTQINLNFQQPPTNIYFANYDFVRKKIYIKVTASLPHGFEIDLNNLSSVRQDYNSIGAVSSSGSFNPVDMIFTGANYDAQISSTDIIKTLNNKGYSGVGNWSAYNRLTNNSVGYGDGDGGKACRSINKFGNLVSSVSGNDFDSSGAGGGQSYTVNHNATTNMTAGISGSLIQNGFTITNHNVPLGKRGTLQNIVSGQTYGSGISSSGYAGIFLTINNNTKTRLFTLKYDQPYMSYAYLDLPSAIVGYDNNQLKL